MNQNKNRLDEASALIDQFAKQLLALNQGKAIPQAWKHRLLKALRPQPKPRGLKTDLTKYAAAVKKLVKLSDADRFERTKKNNPAEHKRKIARALDVSLKTVDRINNEARTLEELDKLTPAKRKARIQGWADAISEDLDAWFENERLVRANKIRMNR